MKLKVEKNYSNGFELWSHDSDENSEQSSKAMQNLLNAWKLKPDKFAVLIIFLKWKSIYFLANLGCPRKSQKEFSQRT